tara:strand:+ start:64 stop:1065 length:1002 start_codon:yes stop_codon:yes gene_type:complete
MATTGSDFLQGLNTILQSQQERERFKVQQALAMMQFSVAKRQADMQAAATGLETLGKFNEQYKTKIANQFMNATGFDAIIVTPGEGDTAEGALSTMAGKLKKKTYGKFDKDEAEQIASAIYNYRHLKDTSGILNVLTQLGADAQLMKMGQTIKGRSLTDNFDFLGILGSLESIANDAKQSLNNDEDLLREMAEFGTGDYQIQKFGGLFDPAKGAIQEAIDITDNESINGGPSLSELTHSKEDLDFNIDKLNKNVRRLVEKTSKGIVSPDDDAELTRSREMLDDYIEEQSKIVTKINVIQDKKFEQEMVDRERRGDYSLLEEEHPLTTINYPGF